MSLLPFKKLELKVGCSLAYMRDDKILPQTGEKHDNKI